MPPQNPMSAVGLSKADFVKRYWFTTLQMVTVRSAEWHFDKETGIRSSQDFVFMSEGRHFMVPANGQQEFVGPIANRYLDQMAKALAQADNRLEAMADFMYVAEYYNQLVVSVKDLAPEYNPANDWQKRAQAAADTLPPWMQNQPPVAAEHPSQTTPPMPPWEQPPAVATAPTAQPVAAPPIPPQQPQSTPAPQPAAPQSAPAAPAPQVAKGFKASAKAKEETKQFELDGVTFKLVVGTDGEARYYKNDVETDAASFSKAASML